MSLLNDHVSLSGVEYPHCVVSGFGTFGKRARTNRSPPSVKSPFTPLTCRATRPYASAATFDTAAAAAAARGCACVCTGGRGHRGCCTVRASECACACACACACVRVCVCACMAILRTSPCAERSATHTLSFAPVCCLLLVHARPDSRLPPESHALSPGADVIVVPESAPPNSSVPACMRQKRWPEEVGRTTPRGTNPRVRVCYSETETRGRRGC